MSENLDERTEQEVHRAWLKKQSIEEKSCELCTLSNRCGIWLTRKCSATSGKMWDAMLEDVLAQLLYGQYRGVDQYVKSKLLDHDGNYDTYREMHVRAHQVIAKVEPIIRSEYTDLIYGIEQIDSTHGETPKGHEAARTEILSLVRRFKPGTTKIEEAIRADERAKMLAEGWNPAGEIKADQETIWQIAMKYKQAKLTPVLAANDAMREALEKIRRVLVNKHTPDDVMELATIDAALALADKVQKEK